MHIDYTATLTAPLHHGAGNAGNTSLLRTEQIILPDGTPATVPFVSGNSIRHGLRDALAWHLVHTLDIQNGALSQGVTGLLFSGAGGLSAGNEIDISLLRSVEELLPQLMMLGYSARSYLITSTLHVSQANLVCYENASRLPTQAAGLPHAARRAAAYRGEEFGTRHDLTGTPAGRYLDVLTDATSTQMIYDLQTIKPGAVLSGEFWLTPAATQAHEKVLTAALGLWAPNGIARLGAKAAVGYGTCRIDGLPDGAEAVSWLTSHLTDHRDEILDLLDRIAG